MLSRSVLRRKSSYSIRQFSSTYRTENECLAHMLVHPLVLDVYAMLCCLHSEVDTRSQVVAKPAGGRVYGHVGVLTKPSCLATKLLQAFKCSSLWNALTAHMQAGSSYNCKGTTRHAVLPFHIDMLTGCAKVSYLFLAMPCNARLEWISSNQVKQLCRV